MPHRWTEDDDIVAFYIYRFGLSPLYMTTKEVSEILGMSDSSLKMRLEIFKLLMAVAVCKIMHNYQKRFSININLSNMITI